MKNLFVHEEKIQTKYSKDEVIEKFNTIIETNKNVLIKNEEKFLYGSFEDSDFKFVSYSKLNKNLFKISNHTIFTGKIIETENGTIIDLKMKDSLMKLIGASIAILLLEYQIYQRYFETLISDTKIWFLLLLAILPSIMVILMYIEDKYRKKFTLKKVREAFE